MKKKKLHLKEEEEHKFLNKKIKKINNKNNIIDSNPKKIHFLKIITEISKSECNFNTLCAFNSVDDILYLIYSEKNNNSIICYNLIDNKRINIIKNANKDPIISLRHFLDKNQNRDLLISISLIISENGFKLWNINNFECIYNFNNIYDNYSELSVCVLNDNNENYIITGIAITGTFSKAYEKNIKIFNFNGNK